MTLLNSSFIRVRYYCFVPTNNQLGVNAVYYQCVPTAGGGVADTDAATRLESVFAPFYKPLMAPTAQWWGVGVALMADSPSIRQQTSEVYSHALSGVGTAIGDTIPNQVSYVIALKTGRAGAHFKGRIYPPFPTDNFATVEGDLTAAGIVQLQQLAAQIQSQVVVTVGGAITTLVPTVRQVFKAVPPAVGIANITYSPVSLAIGRGRFATQRKRGQYGRTNSLPA